MLWSIHSLAVCCLTNVVQVGFRCSCMVILAGLGEFNHCLLHLCVSWLHWRGRKLQLVPQKQENTSYDAGAFHPSFYPPSNPTSVSFVLVMHQRFVPISMERGCLCAGRAWCVVGKKAGYLWWSATRQLTPAYPIRDVHTQLSASGCSHLLLPYTAIYLSFLHYPSHSLRSLFNFPLKNRSHIKQLNRA